MWDPTVSSTDYVIGYEDRFKGKMFFPFNVSISIWIYVLGVKEIPLGSWKREVEDEAFVS